MNPLRDERRLPSQRAAETAELSTEGEPLVAPTSVTQGFRAASPRRTAAHLAERPIAEGVTDHGLGQAQRNGADEHRPHCVRKALPKAPRNVSSSHRKVFGVQACRVTVPAGQHIAHLECRHPNQREGQRISDHRSCGGGEKAAAQHERNEGRKDKVKSDQGREGMFSPGTWLTPVRRQD
jgi:hypothetical protein